jgi:hypothetical protein
MKHAGNYVEQGRAIFTVAKAREVTPDVDKRSGMQVVRQELLLTPVGGVETYYYERKVTSRYAHFDREYTPLEVGDVLEVEWHKTATGRGYYTSRRYPGLLPD